MSQQLDDINPDDQGDVQLLRAISAGLTALNKVQPGKDKEGKPLPEPRKLVGKPATLTLRDGFGGGPGAIFAAGAERLIHGVVARAERRTEGSEARLTLTIRPAIFPLTLGRSYALLLLASHADWSLRVERDGRIARQRHP